MESLRQKWSHEITDDSDDGVDDDDDGDDDGIFNQPVLLNFLSAMPFSCHIEVDYFLTLLLMYLVVKLHYAPPQYPNSLFSLPVFPQIHSLDIILHVV